MLDGQINRDHLDAFVRQIWNYLYSLQLEVIHSTEPQTQLVVNALYTLVRLSVRLYFFIIKRDETNLYCQLDYGLAEWIIDDSCLILRCFVTEIAYSRKYYVIIIVMYVPKEIVR